MVLMMARTSIIEKYANADAKKVDIICKNYSNLIGILKFKAILTRPEA